MNRMATSLVALATLACAGSVAAHHSISTVDITTPVWVKGTVTRRMQVDNTLLERGDVIDICGFHYKNQVAAHAETGAALPPAMHGHLLVMPNGRKQPWGPYGKLNNCVRAGDDAQSWVDFLNADAIDRRLTTPCQ